MVVGGGRNNFYRGHHGVVDVYALKLVMPYCSYKLLASTIKSTLPPAGEGPPSAKQPSYRMPSFQDYKKV